MKSLRDDLATLPKPRYRPARPPQPGTPAAPRLQALPGKGAVSASSSLLGLQAQAPPAVADPARPESGFPQALAAHLSQVEQGLKAVWRWWLRADFLTRQLPAFVLALGIWAMTARSAWQSEESATPLLLQSIAQIRQARAHPHPQASGLTAGISVTVPAVNISPQPSPGAGRRVLASLRLWLLPQPAAPEEVDGNPNERVWVDMKTGLYYCPGADYYGYGGDSRGKVMSQKVAQYDYFQPATGAPC